MASDPFLPFGNGVSISASTTSSNIGPLSPAPSVVVTNRSTTSPAWIAWHPTTPPVAAFPVPGAVAGAPGMEVAPGAQVSISTNGQNAFCSVVLLSGTGIVSIVPGNGV